MVEWEWYLDDNTFRLFLHLLLNANHESKKWRGTVIDTGQRLTSLGHLAEELRLGVQQIRTSLNKLKSTNELTIKSTNKNTLITIVNWSKYQKEDIKVTSKITNEQQTTNKQLTTNKKYKNEKNKPASQDDALVSSVIKAFEVVDPKNKNYYGNTTQRSACSFLIGEYGFEEVLKRISVLPRTNSMMYFPLIYTPVQLRDKWVQLQQQVERRRNDLQAKKAKVI